MMSYVSALVLVLACLVSCQLEQEQDTTKHQYGNQLLHEPEEDDEEKRAAALGMDRPRIKDVKIVKIDLDEDGNTLSEPKVVAECWDVQKNYNVVATVPRYFEHLSQERLLKELEFHQYVKNGSGWSERVVLELFYYAVVYGTDHEPADHEELPKEQKEMRLAGNWLKDNISICMWDGVTCGCGTGGAQEIKTNSNVCNMVHNKGPETQGSITTKDWIIPPSTRVTKLDLTDFQFRGTLPSELHQLKYLYRLNLNDNYLRGTIPTTFGLFKSLTFMDIGVNTLEGTFPVELALLNPTIEELWCERNYFSAKPFPEHLTKLTRLEFIDLSENYVGGPLPADICLLTRLESLFLEENQISGSLPTELGLMTNLKVLDLGFNNITGTLPTELFGMKSLTDINLVYQKSLGGALVTDLWRLTSLENLLLSDNRFTGTIPSDTAHDSKDVSVRGWTKLSRLSTLALDRNQLSGTVPPDLFIGVGPSLTSVDLGFNRLTGTIPAELGYASNLERLAAPSNKLRGSIPEECSKLDKLANINFTANLMTGSVPASLCDTSYFDGYLVEEFGCDAVLCPPGTFHPDGAAGISGICQPCPAVSGEDVKEGEPHPALLLGRTFCDGVTWTMGDMDADGAVSPREVLRLLYINTCLGWGREEFKVWKDMNVSECNLPGISCVGGEVVKIDLAYSGGSNEDPTEKSCRGLPKEIGLLSSLEVLVVSNQKRLQGSIPSELGLLTNLRLLDLSNCPTLGSSIPSEVGMLSNLRVMHLYGTNVTGSLPDELFSLSLLEKMNLSQSRVSGSLPTGIGRLTNIREMMLSRSLVCGSVPSEIGQLALLENLELYSNAFTGQIPDAIGNCENLRRVDLFNNRFHGTIPSSFGKNTQIQILHLKRNTLTGTIPESIGTLPNLSWFDASSNYLEGLVPPFESSQIVDLRLGANRLYDPIPPSLCSNTRINGGHTKTFGCDAILCPLGTYSDTGYASDSVACTPCPAGETTLYLGDVSCLELSQEDILTMFYHVMQGEDWPSEHQEGWKNPEKYNSVCEWSSISCDENGEITSLSFPISNSDFHE